MKKVSIVIPAYNEEKRIGKMLQRYVEFFTQWKENGRLDFELLVVLNGCKDNTKAVVQEASQRWPGTVLFFEIPVAGKGLAITAGFQDALLRSNDVIGFVDADMSTEPYYFLDLINFLGSYDGIIASRYMPGAYIEPRRPWIKEWGRKLVFHNLIRLLFRLKYHDFQCGAKLFKRDVIKTITPQCRIAQWACDVELLYLCKKCRFKVREFPTTWYDKTGSKLKLLSSGMGMLSALFKLRLLHSPFARFFDNSKK